MPKFLNTSATNYFLEEVIKNASERLVLISPFLKINERIRELLDDKNRLKIDVRIVYGKSDLQPQEIGYLNGLRYVRTSFCRNLHAKCYLNEDACIITSLNLYEFSQVNNNEMGVLIRRGEDGDLYRDAYEEAQRLIRISDEVRISMDMVEEEHRSPADAVGATAGDGEHQADKLSTSRLARKLGLKTQELLDLLVQNGFLEMRGDRHYLTAAGKDAGGEFRNSSRFGPYFLWPEPFTGSRAPVSV